MANLTGHTSCPKCSSSDARATYDDNSSYCFSCGSYFGPNGTESIQEEDYRFLQGSYRELTKRKITEETCRKYWYQVGDQCHLANYVDPKTKRRVSQKVRRPDKSFTVIGGGKHMPLYGQHLWATGGKSIVITEGEIDCLSVAQAFSCKWPVVSLPNGSSSVKQSLTDAYEWLISFDKIVLCFDMDTPGRKATQEACELLPYGKAYVMSMPEGYKDANDVLVALGAAPLTQAYWNASQYRPDGILKLSDLRESVVNRVSKPSIPYPWECLNAKLKGIRTGELVTLTAGSGLGKSTVLKEILYDLAVNHSKPVGLVFLEEQGTRTAEILASMYLNKNILADASCASKGELEEAFDALGTKSISIYSHFGSNDVDSICNKIRFMVQAEGIHYVFLDHLSILVSDSEGDERKLIDSTMTKLRTLVSELDFSLFIISHLKRPQGDKGHEDGLKISLGQLRGSHAIAQLSDTVIGIEKPSDDPTSDQINLVILKNRLTGERGPCGTLTYSRETGRLTESGF